MKKNDPRLIAGHELEHHVFPTRQNKIENLKRERVKKGRVNETRPARFGIDLLSHPGGQYHRR